MHTDGHAVLDIEHIAGYPLDAERYSEQPLDEATLHATTRSGIGSLYRALAPGCAI